MPDLADGETFEMQGSAAKPYVLKNTGGVYSCSCPAWRNQSLAIEKRTCKHLRKLRGEAAEAERVGSSAPPPRKKAAAPGGDAEPTGASAPPAGAPVLLAQSWDGALDPKGWWLSEKLDGVRAYWNGKQFLSRLGNVYHAPDWFLKGLPATALDGELFLDRKSFQKTIAIVRRQDKSDLWKSIRYLIFDAPAHGGKFEERMESLRALPALAQAAVHPQARCAGKAHVVEELKRVEALGGEGLMLRQPESLYVVGRSATLLKVKSFQDDEAVVIGHLPGTGRHKGRLGALQVRLADGTEFAIGTGFSDKEREVPPAIGATVVFRYQELTDGGVPRFPSFSAVREE
jgi:DNA ligase 1